MSTVAPSLPPRSSRLLGRGKLLFSLLPPLVAVVLFGGLLLQQWSFAVVSTGSMEPAIKVGDIVMLRPTPARELQKGDVITMAPRAAGINTKVTHRVEEVRVQEGSLQVVTKGDANPGVDPWTTSYAFEDKAARTALVIPYVGHATIFAQANWKLLLGWLLLAVPLLWWWRRTRSPQAPATPTEEVSPVEVG